MMKPGQRGLQSAASQHGQIAGAAGFVGAFDIQFVRSSLFKQIKNRACIWTFGELLMVKCPDVEYIGLDISPEAA